MKRVAIFETVKDAVGDQIPLVAGVGCALAIGSGQESSRRVVVATVGVVAVPLLFGFNVFDRVQRPLYVAMPEKPFYSLEFFTDVDRVQFYIGICKWLLCRYPVLLVG
jgi:hypothetical protein